MSTATEDLIAAQTEVEAAEAKLQEAKMKRDGVTTLKRSEWDALGPNKPKAMIDSLRTHKLIIVDD